MRSLPRSFAFLLVAVCFPVAETGSVGFTKVVDNTLLAPDTGGAFSPHSLPPVVDGDYVYFIAGEAAIPGFTTRAVYRHLLGAGNSLF